MSTIQSVINLVHIESGIPFGAAVQRTSEDFDFSVNAFTVTTTPEALDLGGIAIPRQIGLKLVSGDPLLISLDGGSTYPLSLNGAGDPQLIGLESREISEIVCTADTANNLDGKHFDIQDSAGPVRVWINTSGGSATAPAVLTGGRLIEVAIATGAANTVVAAAVRDALNADGKFIVTASSATLTITDILPGSRTGIATDYPSSFTGATSLATSPPVVYLQSLGTSEVVKAVAPA